MCICLFLGKGSGFFSVLLRFSNSVSATLLNSVVCVCVGCAYKIQVNPRMCVWVPNLRFFLYIWPILALPPSLSLPYRREILMESQSLMILSTSQNVVVLFCEYLRNFANASSLEWLYVALVLVLVLAQKLQMLRDIFFSLSPFVRFYYLTIFLVRDSPERMREWEMRFMSVTEIYLKRKMLKLFAKLIMRGVNIRAMRNIQTKPHQSFVYARRKLLDLVAGVFINCTSTPRTDRGHKIQCFSDFANNHQAN